MMPRVFELGMRLSGVVLGLIEARRRRGADRHTLVALAVFAATALLLGATATQGFVRDEGYYFRAAREYHGWFEELWQQLLAGTPGAAFADAKLQHYFGYNTEHPGFVKILMGFSWRLFHETLGWVSHATGYRLASISLVAVGTAFIYLFGARLFSWRVGLVAVGLFLAAPHVFFHAHLAAFDGPIVGLTVASTYAFWRSLEDSRWVLAAGVWWGLAVATKHNAVFLVPTFALAVLVARLGELRASSRFGLALPGIPLAFVSMAVAGPLLFYVFYPYGWHAPLDRIGEYYRFHLHHEHYPVDYFGTLYYEPPFPWSYPYVMTALTVPLPLLVPGLVGLARWSVRAIREPSARMWTALLTLSALVPPFIIAIPTVPIFGGTKHWMPMMPFLCLAAAWVVCDAAALLAERSRRGRIIGSALIVAVLAACGLETWRTHPYGHTYFNELALGHQGGAALGMPRTFWGGDARVLLDVLNAKAAPNASVFPHRMNVYDFQAYQRDGLLRADLRWSGDLMRAEWVLINHQREYQDEEYAVWEQATDDRPVASFGFDGVPIVSLYRNGPPPPRLAPAPATPAPQVTPARAPPAPR